MARALIVLWMIALLGCADPNTPPIVDLTPVDQGLPDGSAAPDEGVPDASPDLAPDLSPEPVAWTWGACDVGYRGECARVEMPLDWEDPDNERTFTVHVSRRQGTLGGQRSLWLLQGGPGGSARGLAQLVDALGQLAPAWTVYTIEHRGVGASGHLSCPEQEAADSEDGPQITAAEWPACVAWVEQTHGAELPWISPTQSAYDLLHAVKTTRAPGERVVVMGLSYGTYWAHRALQLDAAAFDAVILDSIIPPGADYGDFERHAQLVGEAFLAKCAEDATCRERLGEVPEAFLRDLLERLAQGHCAEAEIDADALKAIISGVLMGDQGLRSFIAPLLHRLGRCDEADRAAIAAFSRNLFPPGQDGGLGDFSLVLQNHVVLSELWSDPPRSASALQEIVDGNLFAFDAAPTIATSYEIWPRHERPTYAPEVAQTNVPLLMLAGDLDPRAPPVWGDVLGTQLVGANQHYLVVPGATHGVMFQSAVATPGQLPCGLQIALAFMRAPTAELETGCLGDLRAVEFAPAPDLSQRFLETQDPWGQP